MIEWNGQSSVQQLFELQVREAIMGDVSEGAGVRNECAHRSAQTRKKRYPFGIGLLSQMFLSDMVELISDE